MDDSKYLIQKIDKISDDIVDIKVTLGHQAGILETHVKRTDLLETKVDILKEEVMKNKGFKDTMVFITKISPILAAVGAGIAKLKGLF